MDLKTLQTKIKIKKEPYNLNVNYCDAIKQMAEYVECIKKSTKCPDLLWLLTHEDTYTTGKLSSETEILDKRIKITKSARGGKTTYHGRGQRVCYPIIDLKKKYGEKPNIKKYISDLQNSVIYTLKSFNIDGFQKENQIGIWVLNKKNKQEEKIASLGIKVEKWIASHGIAVNINTDLSKFNKIKPCGMQDIKMCSIQSLQSLQSPQVGDFNAEANINKFDKEFIRNFLKIFQCSVE